MQEEAERLFYLGVGPLAAVLLGMALMPLRGVTTASNFTFGFLALTIVVAELGGRWAAVATAVSSALSLDFFLTQPYLRLSIEDKHDAIAFFGLAACGLLAAALASQRGRRGDTTSALRKQMDLLQSAVGQLERAGPLDLRLSQALEALRLAFPVAAAVVRDTRDQVLAASARAHGMAAPARVLEPDTLLPAGTAGSSLPARGLPLPSEGARIALVAGNRQVGWLDLWGSGGPASPASRRALSSLARVVAALVAGGGSGTAGLSRDRPPE
jgi:K+-sensing histidine kinase KdpD